MTLANTRRKVDRIAGFTMGRVIRSRILLLEDFKIVAASSRLASMGEL